MNRIQQLLMTTFTAAALTACPKPQPTPQPGTGNCQPPNHCADHEGPPPVAPAPSP